MKIFGLAGWSGSGKTTLMVRLLPEITGRGYTVSTIKHAHHTFEIDTPGKDSFEHRSAGATEVMISGGMRWALMHENREAGEPAIKDLLRHMTPVDLVMVEGFKTYQHPKLEVHRPALGKPLICMEDNRIVAVASNEAIGGLPVPVLGLDDVSAIADFILEHSGLAVEVRHGTA
ncbi:MAG: molybdopterin-guanine dinucleotide biosynthesis protein B [Rhodospirillales bacterium]|nr:MAG: molybdopterin-guanine dinucleotide biosynthesis protein B [Rhodospirillales bacterium]